MDRISRNLPVGLSVALFLLFTAVLSHAAQVPTQQPPYIPNEVIVKFHPGIPEFNKAMARSRVFGIRLRAFRIIDGLERHRLPVNISVEQAIAIYRQDPDVLYAEPNYIVRTTNTPNDPRFGDLWGLNNIGQSGGTPDADIDALSAWDITTGDKNVVVAVLDTGIDYNHQDLSANMFRNALDCNNNGIDDDGNGHVDDCFGIDVANNDSNPLDDNNHGSHVAGTIGAAGNNNAGVVGINWNVGLMACKFFDANGSGTTAGAVTCLEYVKTMKERGVNIVATNNSWGGGGFSQALFDAIEAHQQLGILFIAAAGNGNFFGFPINNDQTPFYPCTYELPNILCVAATTRTDGRASFSNYGRRTVHIGAPGYEILSTTRNNTYATFNGTSMATPHVTGVAALLNAANPDWDWKSIRNLILAGGDGIASMSSTITQKRLNANGALACSNSPLFSRLRPIEDTVIGEVGVPITLSVLNINCADPNGEVAVSIDPGGQVLTLLDDGVGADQASGDGIYSGVFTPPGTGNFTLTFPDGSILTVSVSTPAISVLPASLDFGVVHGGISIDRTITVQNVGSGTLVGNSTTNVPYAIVSGGSYSLLAGQSQTVTVRFSPTVIGSSPGNVIFSGGGGAVTSVTGVGAAPVSLNVSPTTIFAGATVTADWSGIFAPTTKDWLGLYAVGTADTSSLAWRYSTGTASGTVPFVLPASLAPGTYELRLFANNGYTRLAISNTFTVSACSGTTLSASPTSAVAGGTVTVSWNGVCTPTTKDWLGLYAVGTADTSSLAWRYSTGTASGTVPFVLPASLAPGTYELRLFANNGYTRLAISNTFTVSACSGTTLSASPTSAVAGGTVTVSWNGVCTPTTKDWLGLYAVGTADTSSLAWRYSTGTASGTVPFVLPASLAPGTYELRLFANNGYTRLAISNTFTVSACSGTTLSASPTSAVAGGTVTVSWNGVCTPTTKDWLGLYAVGTADTSSLAWRYSTGTASGTVPFVLPASLAPGTYELRLFANKGYTRLAISNTFGVTSP